MARPLSEDRRAALLEAATKTFAEHGVAASTALVSKTAGVSEGSLFTYFKTKDELIVEVYRELRRDLGAAVSGDFPRKASVRDRLAHVFSRYVGWGVANPVARRALRHVSMAKAVTAEVRAETATLFAEVERIQEDAVAQRKLAVPGLMASHALKALAEMTMNLVAAAPAEEARYIDAGFRMLWGALTAKP